MLLRIWGISCTLFGFLDFADFDGHVVENFDGFRDTFLAEFGGERCLVGCLGADGSEYEGQQQSREDCLECFHF